ANHVGNQRLQELLAAQGVDRITAGMDELIGAGELRMRAAIGELRPGDYTAEDYLNGPEGRVTIRATVSVRQDSITADFSATDPQVKGPINCRLATLRACLTYAVVALLDPAIAPNAGTTRPLRIVAPEGSLVNARHPASTVQSNLVTSQRICDVLFAAL